MGKYFPERKRKVPEEKRLKRTELENHFREN
jgi:hypothetical protein